MKFTKNLRIRDPFVVVFDGAYYLYQSDEENHAVKVYKGDDLETWDDGRTNGISFIRRLVGNP